MTGVIDIIQGVPGNSQTSIALAYPDESASNPGGVGDELVILVGYGNSAGTAPATPTLFTAPTGNSVWGGAGSWASETGPRGTAVFYRVSDGTEPLGVATVTNKALTSNVATLTTSAQHGYVAGDQVTVASVGSPFDGTFTLTAATSTTLSYAKTNANIASAAATGTVTGTVSVNNGGTGTDRTMRACMYRLVRDTDTTGWATPVVVTDTDTSNDTTLNIAPGSNPAGSNGDFVMAAVTWVPSTTSTSGSTSSAIGWAGAAATGSTTQRSTGATTGGNKLRTNHYSAPVTGTATGNLSLTLTFGTAVAGSGLLVRFRTVGQLPVADAGPAQQNAEPGRPATLDATFSSGIVASYDWEHEDPPSTWTDVAGSGAIRTVTNPATVGGSVENYRVRVTDVDSNVSAYDTTTIEVMDTTEFAHDGAGNWIPVLWYVVT